MGNQHSNQLNLKELNKKIKQKSRLNLSLSNSSKNKVKERCSAFLCHSNGSLIANVQFKCNFCSTVKRSALAVKQHYTKRHHFFETSSTEQLNESDQKHYFTIEQINDKSKSTNCTLFIQDNDLIIRCSSLNYGIMKFDENGDEIDISQQADQLESDLRIKRINELSQLRKELTKLNAFSRHLETAENETNKTGPVRIESIRIKKFDVDDDVINSNISNEDQLNNNHYFKENKDRKPPNSASDGTNSSSSSLCQSDAEQTQIDEHLFTLTDDLTKEVEPISETSSIDTTFGLDARCSVCSAHNYVVCIQRRLGRQICANCFRFFRHFLSDPVVYTCHQLGRCELNKPIKICPSSHVNQQQRKSTTNGTVKHVVKQQQLGIFKSKSNVLQSTPKTRRPLQQKELSFYSIASYSNHNSLNDQSTKSMTLNLPKSDPYSYKERNLSPNQSSWTTPSPTQSNVSFALKGSNSVNNDLDSNFNSTSNVQASQQTKVRCNACLIKKCMDIYIEVQFDEKIMKILNDFSPIQLPNLEQTKLNQQSNLQLNQAQINQKSTTLTKQKRFYTNNKIKSKSVSRLYYNSDKNSSLTKSIDQKPKNLKSTNELNNNLNKSTINDPSIDEITNNSSFNNSTNSNSNSSNNSVLNSSDLTNKSTNNETELNKTDFKTNGMKTNRPISSNIPLSTIKTKSNTRLNNRSNLISGNNKSTSSTNTLNASNPINLTSSTKNSKMSNTITINNLPFKSINKSNVKQHSTILPNKTSNVLSNLEQQNKLDDQKMNNEFNLNENGQQLNEDAKKIILNVTEKGIENGTENSTENGTENGTENRTENGTENRTDNGTKNGTDNEVKNEKEIDTETEKVTENGILNSTNVNGNIKTNETNLVRLIFENQSTESKQNVNTIEILNCYSDQNETTKIETDFVKLTTKMDNNLNLLLNTNIHNLPERV